MPVYNFDMKLYLRAEIEAKSEADARDVLEAVLEASGPSTEFVDGFNSVSEKSGSRIIDFGMEPEEGDEPERISPEDVSS